jgi:hypothetical protein
VHRKTSLIISRKRGQKSFQSPLVHLGRVPLAVEDDVSSDPLHVALLGADAVVLEPDALEQLRRGRGRREFNVLSDMPDVIGDTAPHRDQ